MAEQALSSAMQAGNPPRVQRPRIGGRRVRLSGVAALLPLAIFLGIALAGPLLRLDPGSQDLQNRMQAPLTAGGTWDHPLGTDSLGRDIAARVVSASRQSLVIGLLAASMSAVVGVLLGVLSAVTYRWVDLIATGAAEISLSIPTIVFGIVLTATLGQGMANLLTILVVSGWITYSRVLRLQVRSLLRSEFVLAAQSMGATRSRVVIGHLLPNVLPTIIVLFFQQVAAVMIWESSLTYLGLGLPIAEISLGSLVRDGQDHVFDAWWIGVIPGFAIALAVFGFNLAADWLQARLNPALRVVDR